MKKDSMAKHQPSYTKEFKQDAKLKEQGVHCGRKRVARLMRERGISAQTKRRKVKTTDNALMESLFGTLKEECVERQTYQTRAEARNAVFEYIEVFNNRQRIHLKTPCDQWACFDSFLTRKLFSLLFCSLRSNP
jgi:Integrase core domain/HTH-like domain